MEAQAGRNSLDPLAFPNLCAAVAPSGARGSVVLHTKNIASPYVLSEEDEKKMKLKTVLSVLCVGGTMDGGHWWFSWWLCRHRPLAKTQG